MGTGGEFMNEQLRELWEYRVDKPELVKAVLRKPRLGSSVKQVKDGSRTCRQRKRLVKALVEVVEKEWLTGLHPAARYFMAVACPGH